MEQREGNFEHFTNNSIPTPADQESLASTDKINEAVEKLLDGLSGNNNPEAKS